MHTVAVAEVSGSRQVSHNLEICPIAHAYSLVVLQDILVVLLLIFHTLQGILQLHFQFKKVRSIIQTPGCRLIGITDVSCADILQKVIA